jgi:hypothetical protein
VLNDGILYCNALSKVACPVEAKSLRQYINRQAEVVLLLGAVLEPTITISLRAWPPSSAKTTFIVPSVAAFQLLRSLHN